MAEEGHGRAWNLEAWGRQALEQTVPFDCNSKTGVEVVAGDEKIGAHFVAETQKYWKGLNLGYYSVLEG